MKLFSDETREFSRSHDQRVSFHSISMSIRREREKERERQRKIGIRKILEFFHTAANASLKVRRDPFVIFHHVCVDSFPRTLQQTNVDVSIRLKLTPSTFARIHAHKISFYGNVAYKVASVFCILIYIEIEIRSAYSRSNGIYSSGRNETKKMELYFKYIFFCINTFDTNSPVLHFFFLTQYVYKYCRRKSHRRVVENIERSSSNALKALKRRSDGGMKFDGKFGVSLLRR